MTKSCRKCLTEKPAELFARDRRNSDGLAPYCKECSKVIIRIWREMNPEKARRNYRESSKRYHASTQGKPVMKAFNESYPKQQRLALQMAQAAKRAGLIQYEPCVICSNPKSEMHHPDYSQPLKVVHLCRKHHKQLHAGRFSLLPTLTSFLHPPRLKPSGLVHGSRQTQKPWLNPSR